MFELTGFRGVQSILSGIEPIPIERTRFIRRLVSSGQEPHVVAAGQASLETKEWRYRS
jgi:hypothetical protein